MSMIEQAAKRLEELRKAGMELPEATPAAADAVRSDQPPTPEAVIRALEAQETQSPAPSLFQRQLGAKVIGRSSALGVPARHAEIDLQQLAARGFITPAAPHSQLADEFRVVKRPIIRNALRKGGVAVKNANLVMVTSSLPSEGKTFTAVNLAMSVAMEYDNTVLLIDGDVAHPMLPTLLNVPSEPGLLDLLTRDDLDVGDALVRTNVEKLTVLPAGSRHKRATELLASEQMVNLLLELASRYSDRIVIFDSPPLLATTEARVLATHMGQIVMVVAADTTTQHAVSQALSTIESCEIVLMMLNKARKTDVGSYYGYYTDDVEA
jgi:exopolysaccharide/PEP-CTERM locus tyrosine autokinase